VQKNNINSSDVTYGAQRKLIRNNNRKFSQQEVTFDDTPLFFPAGLEKFFLLLYFITLPYLAGLAFLFFYVGNGDTSLFSSLSTDSSYMLTWIIGYELLAVLTLLWILKKAIGFTMNSSSSQGPTKDFRRP
jgi:cellulose synthase/poly-beta-1,6-N-acetylglucosamine synthase-like glycosyltransferase